MSSITVDVLSTAGKKTSKVDLPAATFGADVNVALIHQVVVAQLAAARQGTHDTKTRGEVSGGGAKPWRQKGTGRARQGSRRAPQWAGGGTVFGPTPRSYAQRTPKKMIAAALRSALSDRVTDGRLFVMESIIDDDLPSTRKALAALAAIGDYKSVVVVLHRDEDVAWLSLRNVANAHAIAVDQLNVYDVISNQMIVFTKPALDEFLARVPGGLVAAEVDVEAQVEASPKAKKTVKAEAPAAEPAVDYGEGSYRGSTPPAGFDIKGNEDSMLYHTPESQWYKRTVAEVWFNSAEAAEQAGFTDVMKGKK
ncbi:MAG: 50S ribosomal protein L4 [Propionibacteriaceae bacterium]|jgi:large subunit ribosomal protein L4|nr:50S ribosomal protein L4 [Propionibacteriaceae bacterium]